MARAIIIIAAITAILFTAIWSLVHFAGLQASLLWTAIVGAGAWAVRSSIEQKREYQRLLADKKRAHYFEFLDFLNRFIGPTGKPEPVAKDPGEQLRDDHISLEELRKWSLRLTLIGSDEVVRAWNAIRLQVTEPQEGTLGVGVLRGWGKLWLAMRKDCGHPDTQLKVTDILASFVNDIDEYRSALDAD
jgi:hypothetical protein